ncbi:MAG: hypothetical protein HY298_02385 [Verrucomicrobia bacterium]|nr:hypothetical protein [Verrucomicrobiota bacterium]
MTGKKLVLIAVCFWVAIDAGHFAPFESRAAEGTPRGPEGHGVTTNLVGWSTNGAAVFALLQLSSPTNTITNTVFHHYFPDSLNHRIWTNFVAHTNGRDARIWSVRSLPADWPTNATARRWPAPIVRWNTNGLMWDMKGLTALSPVWQEAGAGGQSPITALTRRHGYTRGHGTGSPGFMTNRTGEKVWFVTTNNTLVEATVLRSVVRTTAESNRDYMILLFNKDLPASIEPLRVVALTNVLAKYPTFGNAPHPVFRTEQLGNVSADVPGLYLNTWKGGDSGSPDLLPLPGELVFFGGRSTSGPSAEMQADMDALCAKAGLNKAKYQLQWVDLSGYPSYTPR